MTVKYELKQMPVIPWEPKRKCIVCEKWYSGTSEKCPECSTIDYEKALSRIETLMDAEPDTPELDELKRLTAIVEKYEDIHYPMRGM